MITELEPKIPKLSIAVMPEAMRLPGIEVKRDGVLVPPSEWGSAIPVDPGPHTVTAWAPGRKPFLKSVDLRGDGAAASVVISGIDMDPAVKGGGDDASKPAARPAPAKSEDGGFGTQHKIALVTGGLGLAAMGVGTAFGLKAAGAKSDSDAHCDGNICTDEGIRIRDEGIDAGNLSTAFFIGGGAAAAAGVVLFLTAPLGGRAKSEVGVTSVTVGPLGGAIRGRF
jgi:hypothetical protein